MKKTNVKKAVHQEKVCSWFDSQNARFIVLCATLGIFGAHKFAQHKYFQGFLYILLDLTVFGIILTLILSWLDLIFLTAKSNNRPGNMILGSAFIILESFIFVPGYDLVIKNIDPESKNVVESSVQKDGNVEVFEKIAVTPMVMTDKGEKIPTKIVVEKDNIMLVVDHDVDTDEKKDDVAEENKDSENTVKESEPTAEPEPIMWVERPVKSLNAPKEVRDPVVKPVKKQAKNVDVSSDGNKKGTDEDFGNFSLYGMIAG